MKLPALPLLAFLVFTSCSLASCQELVRETFCWNQDFRLDCNWSSILVFHEAYFTNDQAEIRHSNCEVPRDGREPCKEDVRPSINKRCSGMPHCHYNLTEDHPDRKCRCNGVIVLLYACVPESNMLRYCNSKISDSSGYISSPGYPRFYPQVSNCIWNIESSEKQEMKLSILDIDMRPGVKTRGKEMCPDSLTVLEDSHKIRQSCGHATNASLMPILTSGGKIQITFHTYEFLPSRGFLLHYKFNGCKKLPPPNLGYMVYNNGKSALYMCCKGHVFNKTMSISLLLYCIDGMYWNGTVTPCISFKEAKRIHSNGSDDYEDLSEKADVVEVYLSKYKYIEEVLIPAASVVGLVFGNVAIILVIQKIRKKRKTTSANNTTRLQRTSISSISAPKQLPQTLHVPVNIPIESTIPKITDSHKVPIVHQAPRVLMTDL